MQNQALSALLFLCRHVLGRKIGELGEVVRARKPKRLPVEELEDRRRGAASRSRIDCPEGGQRRGKNLHSTKER